MISDDPFERHHDIWPKRNYRSCRVERDYRELCCFIRLLRHSVHLELHRSEPPPVKPSRDDMLKVIREHVRACQNCRNHLWQREYWT